MTQIEDLRKKIDTQMKIVQSIYDIDNMDYNNFQFDLGLQVLQAKIIHNTTIQQLSYDKNYWNWFKMQYQILEEETLHYLSQTNNNSFQRYQRMMSCKMINKRTDIAFHQFLTIFKYMR